MKSLHDLVYEKLKLTKHIQSGFNIGHVDEVSDAAERDIRVAMQEKSPSKQASHDPKMEGYMKKGSDPKRLIATIKDNKKLINRWFAAVKLEWDDAIIPFGEAVAERCGFTEMQLHGFILKLYNNMKNSPYPLKDHYEHYLDLYGIKHE